MSSTNKTTNYELSQFIGTDKPAWLTDYNADMSKIDAGVAAAQNTATGADGKADANTTAIGTLANLTTTAKTNLVAAINEVDTNADAAAGTAETAAQTAATAQTNANAASTKVNALADYLSMTATAVASANIVANAGTIGNNSVTIATNNTGTFGKIYGVVNHTVSAAGSYTITLNVDSGIHPDTDITINPAGCGVLISEAYVQNSYLKNVSIVIKTTGRIEIKYWADSAGWYAIRLWPCCYFFENFGDNPDAQ